MREAVLFYAVLTPRAHTIALFSGKFCAETGKMQHSDALIHPTFSKIFLDKRGKAGYNGKNCLCAEMKED